MIRQPASENSLTVAWPIPREAPVNTMVLCSATGCSTRADSPWDGHSTTASPAPIHIDREFGSALNLSTVVAATRLRNAQHPDFRHKTGLHDSGQTIESGFSRPQSPDRIERQLISTQRR